MRVLCLVWLVCLILLTGCTDANDDSPQRRELLLAQITTLQQQQDAVQHKLKNPALSPGDKAKLLNSLKAIKDEISTLQTELLVMPSN